MTKTILYSRWVLIVGSVLSILLLALLIGAPARQTEAAPAATTYAVAWYTADNGGGVSSSGSYEVAGTIGQMDAASGATSSDYGLNAGFWAAWMDRLFEVFLPTVIK
jgi:hypothetical protein